MIPDDGSEPDVPQRGRRFSFWRLFKCLVIIAALGLALIPFPADWVERYYSNGIYPITQRWLTPLSNSFSFPLGDLLTAVVAAALLIWWTIRIRRSPGTRWRAIASLAFNTTVLAAGAYLAFLALWGFNYQRPPLISKLDYDATRLTDEAEGQLFFSAIERLNVDAVLAHSGPIPGEEEWRASLSQTLDEVVTEIGNRQRVTAAVPKTSLIDFYLGKTGVGGFTNPFGLEVVLNSDLHPLERPFTLAHEWAHLAGFADESEANFVALLACARSSMPVIRYSAWLALHPYLSMPRVLIEKAQQAGKWDDVLPKVVPEALEDLRAINERMERRLSPTLSRMQNRVYDGFLKANRVEPGIASYGLFVRLLLGTRFESDWVPAQRSAR
ncbi:MAG TPA: DUF3810 family protein, partial [Blastocatellia bacterium]|jgi:hypothetical protein|nr:DUF3810 family protein [Blastocatellia bacterium]